MVIEINGSQGWQAIGNTSFMGIDWMNRFAEVGIFIGEKSCWNQGFGRETMQLMLQVGFNALNLNEIWLRVHENNLRGIHAYEHAGFQIEGKMRQARYQDGHYYDMVLMSVLRSEWSPHLKTIPTRFLLV